MNGEAALYGLPRLDTELVLSAIRYEDAVSNVVVVSCNREIVDETI